jgi:hypothetical protein
MNFKKIIIIAIIAIIAMTSVIVELNASETGNVNFTLLSSSSKMPYPVYGYVRKTIGNGMQSIPAEGVEVEIFFTRCDDAPPNATSFLITCITDENGFYAIPSFFPINPDYYETFRVEVLYFYHRTFNFTGSHRVDILLDRVM